MSTWAHLSIATTAAGALRRTSSRATVLDSIAADHATPDSVTKPTHAPGIRRPRLRGRA